MSKLLRISALLLIAVFSVSEAAAKTKPHPINIGGTHSRLEMQQQCDKIGGQAYNTPSDGHGDYGCVNVDKGTQVNCNDNGYCTGTVPE